MMMLDRIFISSVQKELAPERETVRDFVRGDALLRRFFEAFLFEDLPAADRRVDEVYLDEVRRCGVYVGIFGDEYGWEDEDGVSPTEREFDEATRAGKVRLIFVKGRSDRDKHPKMKALIGKAGAQLIRRRFEDAAGLRTGLYSALVQLLEDGELIRTGPFDAAFCSKATLDDLSEEEIRRFVKKARRVRGFPLGEDTDPREVLEHLQLLDEGRPTHAAVLLFGEQPQRFLISSEVKCAHFHGTTRTKPIPFYRTYKGTLFETTDQAVDFVMSKINVAVGTREHSTQAPVAYEMPSEVVREAVVNAIAHRDYTSTASVQVMLFSDRLEVWNPGGLPPTLTLEKLREPHGSYPANPLLAEPLYLAGYIERMGTGTGDMIRRCREAGLDEPEFALTDGFLSTIRRKPESAFEAVGGKTGEATGVVTGEATGVVTGEVARILLVTEGEMKRQELQSSLGLKHEDHFREMYLIPALESGLLEMTVPDKPTSPRQRYRLTSKGESWVKDRRERGK